MVVVMIMYEILKIRGVGEWEKNRFGNGRKCRLFWLVGKMIERKQQIPSFFFFFLLLLPLYDFEQKSQSLVRNVQCTTQV